MYWKRVGHVKRSRLPEAVTCPVEYDARELLKAQALHDGYQYVVFCKPMLMEHSYFKANCDLLFRREDPRENFDGSRQYWNYIFFKFKYPNLKPEALENKTEYKRDTLLESGINISDYRGIPRTHFNNISKIIGAVFDYGSEYFTIR